MQKEDFIPGCHYYMWYNAERAWILKLNKIDNDYVVMEYGIVTEPEQSLSTSPNWGSLSCVRDSRPATEEEINWLLESKKVNKFIPKPQFTPTYQIY